MLLFNHYFLLLKESIFCSSPDALKTTLLYFYSTLAQSMAALFAVSGIFLIFRIEMIHNETNRGIDNFRNWVTFRINTGDIEIKNLGIDKEPHSWLPKDVLPHIETALEIAKAKNHPYTKALTDYFKFIAGRLNYQKWLKLFAFPPFILIGLIFCNALYNLAIVDLLVYKYRTNILAEVASDLNLTSFTGIYLIVLIFFIFLGPRDWMINNPKTR
jgi:hypothetical protein